MTQKEEEEMPPETPTPEPTTETGIKRRALKLGLLASLFAVIGRATARAQDALVIEKDTIYARHINFGQRDGVLLTLWNPGVELGVQPYTLYARSYGNFAWYSRGEFVNKQLDPGKGGVKMMALSDGNLTVSGKFNGKGAVPVGAILMWSGDPKTVPAGWALCDGTNGTPPLQDRFVVGYNPKNPDYDKIGKAGGEAKHVLAMAEMPAHNHGPAGAHNHSITITGHGWAFNNSAQNGDPRAGQANLPTSTAPDHTHAMQGEGKAHENRPPYYTLAYIMFTG